MRNGSAIPEIKRILKSGGIGVLPTDTLYGIVGSALRKDAILRIYALRKRNRKKPMIILIGAIEHLDLFGAGIDPIVRKFLNKSWPGAVSIVLPCRSKKWAYLHRGKKSLAFRLPRKPFLRRLLKEVGPLAAPSANLEGGKPAETIREARKYFGKRVDFYVDAGPLRSQPSTLIKIVEGKIVVLRKGAGKI